MNTSKTHFDFDPVAIKYDRCNHFFSLGIDHLWRKTLVETILPHPHQKLLDVCTGTGDLIFSFFKHSRIQHAVGLDLSDTMIDLAQEKQITLSGRRWMSDKDLVWKVADALQTELESDSFDIVTCAFGVRNIPDRMAFLSEMYRVLNPKGRLCILEFSLPSNAILKYPYSFYLTHIMPGLGRFIIRSREPLAYLARSVKRWQNEIDFSSELGNSGFKLIHKTPLSFGIATLWIAGKY